MWVGFIDFPKVTELFDNFTFVINGDIYLLH